MRHNRTLFSFVNLLERKKREKRRKDLQSQCCDLQTSYLLFTNSLPSLIRFRLFSLISFTEVDCEVD